MLEPRQEREKPLPTVPRLFVSTFHHLKEALDLSGFDIDIDAPISRIGGCSRHQLDGSGNRNHETGASIGFQMSLTIIVAPLVPRNWLYRNGPEAEPGAGG